MCSKHLIIGDAFQQTRQWQNGTSIALRQPTARTQHTSSVGNQKVHCDDITTVNNVLIFSGITTASDFTFDTITVNDIKIDSITSKNSLLDTTRAEETKISHPNISTANHRHLFWKNRGDEVVRLTRT